MSGRKLLDPTTYIFRMRVLIFRPSIKLCPFLYGATAPSQPWPPHYRDFMVIIRHTTLGRTSLDEASSWRRSLYLTTHNTHNRPTSMPLAGFQSAVPVSDRPQIHALDCTATDIGLNYDISLHCYSEIMERCCRTLLYRCDKKTGNLKLYSTIKLAEGCS